jgi:hypothetical protein
MSKSGVNPVEKPGVATPVTLDAYTLTDHIFDSSVDTDDLGDITMEENDAIQLHEPIHLGGTICQLGPSAMLRLSVKIQEQPVACVVDSAAEVTIISDNFFQSLERKPLLREKLQCMQQDEVCEWALLLRDHLN